MPDDQAELIFGFVYGIGTNADPIASPLKDYLKQFSYTAHEFRASLPAFIRAFISSKFEPGT
jgi:hypothetical protein